MSDVDFSKNCVYQQQQKELLVPCVLYGIYWITFVEYIYREREREICCGILVWK